MSDAVPGGVVEAEIAVTVHGHFRLRPADVSGPAPLVVGCHGYGETAADLMEELLRIPGAAGWHLCAVQGLHAFYRRSTGKVVASWMTSFNREQAIADNVAYVQAVIEELDRRVAVAGKPAFVGFSQGVAMAYRAAVSLGGNAGPGSAGVVALAGDVPPEVAERRLDRMPPVLIGRGERDGWYDEAKLELDRSRLEAAGVEVETFVFPEGHVWTDGFRGRAGLFLSRRFEQG